MLAEHGPPGAVIDDEMNIVQVRGPHRSVPGAFAGRADPESSETGARRPDCGPGQGDPNRQANERRSQRRRLPDRRRWPAERSHHQGDPVHGARPLPKNAISWSCSRRPSRTAAATAIRKTAIQDNGGSARLRRELAATKEYLQSIVEDHATTLEELRAANEEAQAGNEELETAQEELESANEELNTLNEELKTSNMEFSKVNRDLANLLESISIPLVMVGRDLRIRRFTRAIEPMLNLIASDVGRSITDLQPQMELPDLRRLLLDAMEGGDRKPRDIRDSHGRWYSLRILPRWGRMARPTAP